MTYIWRRRDTHTSFWLENPKERQLARRKNRRLDNYKMQLKETGWNGMG
jgi:hypothetical protein